MLLRTLTVLTVLATLGPALSWAADLPQLVTSPAVPSRTDLAGLNLGVHWTARLPVDGPRDGLGMVQLLDDQVYVQTKGGLMVVYDAENGEPLWRARLAEPHSTVFPVAVNDRNAFLLSRTAMYALDRRTGKLDYSMELPTVASAGALADEQRVFVPLGGTRLSAYELPQVPKQPLPGTPPVPPSPGGTPNVTRGTGPTIPPVMDKSYDSAVGTPAGDARQTTPSLSVLPSVLPPYRLPKGEIAPSLAVVPSVVPPYRLDVGSNTPSISVLPSVTMVGRLNERVQPFSLRPAWNFTTPLRLDDTPLMTAESLFQVSTDRTVLGMAKSENQVIYTFEGDGNVSSPAGQYGLVAYLGTTDNTLYALNMTTGSIIWRVSTTGVVRRRPVATDEDLFVLEGRYGMVRRERKTGREVWANTEAQELLAVGPRFVYATDRLGRLLVLDRKRGTSLGKLDTRDFVAPLRNEANDRLFIGAHNGLLVCLRDRDTVKPVPLQDQKARDEVRPPKAKPMPKPMPGDKPVEKPAEEMPKKPAEEMPKK